MKSSAIASLALCALLAASCGGKKEQTTGESLLVPIDYTLTVTNIEGNDSAYMYLYDYDALAGARKRRPEAILDSVMISEGKATFNVKGSSSPVAMLAFNGRNVGIIFPEAGENTYDFAEGKGSGKIAGLFAAYNDTINAVNESAEKNVPERGTPEFSAYIDSVRALIAKINDSLL